MRSDLQTIHDWNASCQILREAVDAGVIGWDFGETVDQTIISEAALNYMDANFCIDRAPNSGEQESAGTTPKSIHFRENTRGLRLHPSESAPFLEWYTELALFSVPTRWVGVVKGFEQFLAIWNPETQCWSAKTSSLNWGNPFASTLGIWHFRLDKFNNRVPPWWDFTG